MRFPQFLLILFLLSGFSYVHACIDLYVDQNGSDAADGTSWNTPKQSLNAAVTLANASDCSTINIAGGVYVINAPLVISKPTTLQGAGSNATFIADNQTAGPAIKINAIAANGSKILDLMIKPTSFSRSCGCADGVGGIYVSSADNVTIQNVQINNYGSYWGGAVGTVPAMGDGLSYVNGSAPYGIRVNNSKNALIDETQIWFAYWGFIAEGTSTGSFTNSVVRDHGLGPSVYLDVNNSTPVGQTDWKFHNAWMAGKINSNATAYPEGKYEVYITGATSVEFVNVTTEMFLQSVNGVNSQCSSHIFLGATSSAQPSSFINHSFTGGGFTADGTCVSHATSSSCSIDLVGTEGNLVSSPAIGNVIDQHTVNSRSGTQPEVKFCAGVTGSTQRTANTFWSYLSGTAEFKP